jgi:hypothetical protein
MYLGTLSLTIRTSALAVTRSEDLNHVAKRARRRLNSAYWLVFCFGLELNQVPRILRELRASGGYYSSPKGPLPLAGLMESTMYYWVCNK